MSHAGIVAITMPKWGLSMTEGKVVQWLVEEGTVLAVGDEMVDIETEKIANTFEALDAGLLRRKVAAPDAVLPIGALLGVLAPVEVADAEVEAFITEFQKNYVPPERADDDAGPAYQWVEVAGYRLRYSKLGDSGPNVVLVHGFGGGLDNWLFNQDALAAEATVYALDLPGHGQSAKTLTDGSVAALAAVVAGFMQAAGVGQAHLVGHSLGAAIALQTAIAQPDKVQSLSLLAPAGVGSEINGSYLDGFINAESRRELKPQLQQLVANEDLITRQLIDDMLKYKRLDGVTAALRMIAASFANGDTQRVALGPQLAQLGIPVQAIWGAADRIIPAAQAQTLPGNVKSVILDGCGHLIQMEAASEVNARIASFLRA